ncbi:MAG: condensation domain-containing protein, partial [Gammaproteobacteria bacterium]
MCTHHHSVMDGWSWPVFLGELFTSYRSGGNIEALERVTPYADYLAWLAGRDTAAALGVWRDYLAGIAEPTRLVPARQLGASPTVPERWEIDLPADLSARLQRLARERALTLNTLVQGLWAVLLGRLTGRDDVVFGITVADRPAELAGVERMVGLLINTLPLRVRLRPEQPLAVLLAGIQESQSRLLAHQHLGLAEIQQVAGTGELFDTLVAFENYPVERAALTESLGSLRVVGIEGRDATHYPLSLFVMPGERLSLRLDYDPARVTRETAEGLAARFVRLLEAGVARPEVPLHRVEVLGPEERHTLLEEFNATAQPLPEAT